MHTHTHTHIHTNTHTHTHTHQVQEEIEQKEAKSRATVLEMLGDLPDAEMTAPENVLFVVKLNPVTR